MLEYTHEHQLLHRSLHPRPDQRATRPHPPHRLGGRDQAQDAPDEQGSDLLHDHQARTRLQGQQGQGLRPVRPLDGAAGAAPHQRHRPRRPDGIGDQVKKEDRKTATPRKGGCAIIGT